MWSAWNGWSGSRGWSDWILSDLGPWLSGGWSDWGWHGWSDPFGHQQDVRKRCPGSHGLNPDVEAVPLEQPTPIARRTERQRRAPAALGPRGEAVAGSHQCETPARAGIGFTHQEPATRRERVGQPGDQPFLIGRAQEVEDIEQCDDACAVQRRGPAHPR